MKNEQFVCSASNPMPKFAITQPQGLHFTHPDAKPEHVRNEDGVVEAEYHCPHCELRFVMGTGISPLLQLRDENEELRDETRRQQVRSQVSISLLEEMIGDATRSFSLLRSVLEAEARIKVSESATLESVVRRLVELVARRTDLILSAEDWLAARNPWKRAWCKMWHRDIESIPLFNLVLIRCNTCGARYTEWIEEDDS